jgi:spore maturation protein CgeB
MRALVVHPGPEFSVSDVYRGWVKGLRQNGVQVAEFNLHDRLNFYANAHVQKVASGEWVKAFEREAGYRMAALGIETAALRFWPDIVVIISGLFVPPETYDVLRARGMKVVLVHTESPYEDNVQVLRAAHADLNLLNDPTNLEQFRAVAPAHYMPHAYDPDLHRPGPADPELKSDFCFVGTGFESRIEFLLAADLTGLDVLLAGNWQDAVDTPLGGCLLHDFDQCIDNADAVRLYQSTKLSANLYRKEAHAGATADGWAMGPREVELAATGCFFLRESRPESDELLPMLPTFDGPGDFGEKVRWWAAHDDARTDAANRARAAIADRTFERHASDLLRLVAA